MSHLEHIHTITSPNPGPTIVISGGVHGNEQAGVEVIDYLREHVSIDRGTVLLVYGNPEAIEKNVRFVQHNMNRIFKRGLENDSTEYKRACEIMDALDTCDALLDFHAYRDTRPDAPPFIISEESDKDVYQAMDVQIVVHKLGPFCDGTIGAYMNALQKPAVSIELGSIAHPQENIAIGIDSAYRLLHHFGMMSYDGAPARDKKVYEFYYAHFKENDDFSFTQEYKSFDDVRAGDVIAHDGGKELSAQYDGKIIFPFAQDPIGSDVYMLLKEM